MDDRMVTQLHLPSQIISKEEGYSHLIELYTLAINTSAAHVIFNFSKTTWFEANLCAVLGAICEQLDSASKTYTFLNMNPSIEKILRKNGFLCHFGFEPAIDSYNTTISYKRFKPNEDGKFMDYIKQEMLSKPDFPNHTPALGKKITESIFELYENARTHGHCRRIHTCGQHYPNKTPARLDVSIVDMGISIKKNVNDYLGKRLSGVQAIEWALKYGNTTKTGNISGGLGLDIMFQFIQMNKGKVQIVSSDGYWESRKGQLSSYVLQSAFPGTIVNIEFNLSDDSSYMLVEEISIDDIF